MPGRGGRNEEATTAPVRVVVTALEACEATRSDGRQHPSHRAQLATRLLRHVCHINPGSGETPPGYYPWEIRPS